MSDNVGNPLNDGTWTYTWQHGRQLASMAKTGETWQYSYNVDGLRIRRTNGSKDYRYTYLGDQLTRMTVDGHTLTFTYNASGTPISLTYDGTDYYYITNLQGDIVTILDNTGTQVVRYTYNAWGNLISTTGDAANTVGLYNPLRYRGYVYDVETELYYLQSRYYNPKLGRFINADGWASTGQGILGSNMFAYCGNNPVMRIDASGCDWRAVLAMAGGATMNALTSWLVSWATGEKFTWLDAGVSAFCGAIGTLGGGWTVASGAVSGVYDGVMSYRDDRNVAGALITGTASFLSTVVTVGNFSKVANLVIEEGVEATADVIFGVANSFISAGTSKVASSILAPKQHTSTGTTTMSIVNRLQYNQSYRIWNGAMYTVHKNCSIPGYMLDGETRIYCYVEIP